MLGGIFMPRTATFVTIAAGSACALVAAGGPSAAAAGRTTASIKLTPAKPAVGATLVLDATRSKCAAKPCRFTWTMRPQGGRAVKVAAKARATRKLTVSGAFVVV